MATSKTLQLLAKKLGLAEDEKVLRKAAEFERLLQIKLTSANNLTDTGKVVICLDLAASLLGAEFDQRTAIKFSGLKGPSYNNSKKVVENLLDLNNDVLSVSSLCLNLQCTGVQNIAEAILQEYEKVAKMEIDMTLPQYVCMAVYQACRVNKVKVTKSKIIEKSRLKPGQWSKMEAEWTKIVDEKFTTVKKRGRPPKITVVEDETPMEVDNSSPKEEKVVPEYEPYEDWKRRMLEQAYAELREMENNLKKERKKETERRKSLCEELRKSPRKTPQKTPQKSPQKTPNKFTPYKSPQKGGVRIIFPKM